MVNWKVVAWIFIILFMLETCGVVWIYKVGVNEINKEIECSNDVCHNINSDSFIFDSASSTCYCYKGGEVVYQKYLR